MGTPLEEYYDLPPVAPTSIHLPALERKKNEAVDKLNSMAARICFMDGTNPQVKDLQRSAQHATSFIQTMVLASFSPYEICKYAEDRVSHLQGRVTEYEKSKAEYGQKSMDYTRTGELFDSKLKNNNISSSPLDFARGSNQKYAPWDGPGINETQLSFPSKEKLASCVKTSPTSREGNNPYLNDIKVVDRVSGALAGKEMVGLHMKHEVLRKVGEMRDKGDLDHIPPGPENCGLLAGVYETVGKCAFNVKEPQKMSTPLEEKSKKDVASDIATMLLFSDTAY